MNDPKKDPNNEKNMHPSIKLTFVTDSRFFGPGTVSLIREIDCCGNVREACERCGFSYSKGWTILKRCEEKSGFKIVERQPGGTRGGIAVVTDEGHELLKVYEKLETELMEIANERFRELMLGHELIGGKEK